jgi:hypothetical protein
MKHPWTAARIAEEERPLGDPSTVRRCGAKTRRGTPCMPMSRNSKRTMQASRRAQYVAEDAGRYQAHPAGRNEARTVLQAGDNGTAAVYETAAPLAGDAGSNIRRRERTLLRGRAMSQTARRKKRLDLDAVVETLCAPAKTTHPPKKVRKSGGEWGSASKRTRHDSQNHSQGSRAKTSANPQSKPRLLTP